MKEARGGVAKIPVQGSALPSRSIPEDHGSFDFQAQREALLDGSTLQGWELCRALSDLADTWLGGLLRATGREDVALVAVGGYGRRELFPGGDLDLVLLHGGRRSGDLAKLAERIWYPVWDAHVELDHSVRTVREALAVAEDDLKAALGLLDARVVAGDGRLGAQLGERALAQWRATARRRLPVLAEQVAARHEREGEVAFLLEPDLKRCKGGFRDRGAIAAALAAAPALGADAHDIAPAASVLARVRAELHRLGGRASDRLLLQDQDELAPALGYADADALALDVAAAGRAIAWASDDVWERAASWHAGPAGRVAHADRHVSTGVVLREGAIEVEDEPAVLADPSVVLRAAAAAARLGARLSRKALARLARAAAPGDPWPPEGRDALVSLLGAGRPAIAVIEDLDREGLLVRLLPEWSPVRSRPQRNAYHHFTVDRHLLETAAEAASLVRRVGRPDLLLVAALLHDIGKGYPGDHTEAGVDLVGRIARRLGFPAQDAATLVVLVRHHLLLADTAMRRDISDPATARAVAEAVGDEEALRLLAALTEADSKATGELAWSAWKETLVTQLVDVTAAVLAGRAQAPPSEPGAGRHRDLIDRAKGGWAAGGEGDRLRVAAPDMPGHFSLVAGVLALEGLEVLAASAWSAQGVALSELVVRSPLGEPIDWGRVERRLAEVAARPESLQAALERRASDYERGRRSAAAEPGPRVTVAEGASESATVVEVAAADRIGLLHRVTRVIADLGLDIRHAKVLTLGQEVVDTFYLVDRRGDMLRDKARLAELEASLMRELS